MAQISIAVVSDTKQAAASVKSLSTEYSDLVEQLRLLGPDGATAADQLESSMKAAQIATQDAATASSQLVTDINKAKVAAAEQGVIFQGASDKVRSGTDEVSRNVTTMGETIEEKGKLGESALMNLGYSAGSAGSLFSDGISGMAEQVGTFAAFMGPAFAGIEGAVGALAWPVTIAGVAIAALGGLMQSDSKDAQDLTKAVQDYVSAALGSAAGSDALDQGIRQWAKSADDFGGVALTDLSKDAKDAGVAFGGIASSIATQSLPAMQKQLTAVNTQKESIEELIDAQQSANAAGGTEATKSYDKQLTGLGHLQDALKKNIEQQKLQEQILKEVAQQAGFTSVAAYKKYEDAVSEGSQVTQDFASNLSSVNDQKADPSKAFDVKQYLANLKAVETANQNFIDAQNTMIQDGLNQSGEDFVAKNQETAAAAWAAAKGNPKEQSALVQAWNTAGAQSAEKFGEEIGEGIAKALQNAKTAASKADIVAKMRVDDSALKAAIAAQYNVDIPVNLVPYAGKKLF